MTIGLILAAAAAAAQPSPEALTLARQIAAHGALAEIAPLQTRGEIEDLIRSHAELTDSERQRLRAIGEEHSKALIDAAIAADAKALAAELSIEDLRALAAISSSPAYTHYRAAMPKILAAARATLGNVDYAGGVRAAFCSETGKLCDKK